MSKRVDNWVIVVIVILAALLIANLFLSGSIFRSILGVVDSKSADFYFSARLPPGGTGTSRDGGDTPIPDDHIIDCGTSTEIEFDGAFYSIGPLQEFIPEGETQGSFCERRIEELMQECVSRALESIGEEPYDCTGCLGGTTGTCERSYQSISGALLSVSCNVINDNAVLSATCSGGPDSSISLTCIPHCS
jgi:hypothetical protein